MKVQTRGVIFLDDRGLNARMPGKLVMRCRAGASGFVARRTRSRLLRSQNSLIGDPSAPVVTLTSFGSRLQHVALTIESIGRGHLRPSRIVLWVDDKSAFENLPSDLVDLKRRGLEVRLTDNNGPHTKYYPWVESSDSHGRSFVTADDDIMYPRWWLRGLVDAAKETPDTVVCYRAHRIALTDGVSVAPYDEWTSVNNTSAHPAVFATGVSGVLYPPAMREVLHQMGPRFRDTCLSADDVWLHWCALTHGVPVRQVVGRSLHFWITPQTQETTLMESNLVGGNDRAVGNIYGSDEVVLVSAPIPPRRGTGSIRSQREAEEGP